MTITQMECFAEAAKTLNFTKAAENLYISQQVMSRQIKALEKELDFPVFERKNTGVRLTPAGALLYREWRQILEKYRSSVDKASDLYYGELKQVHIGVSDLGTIVEKVKNAILEFNEKYPDLDVEYVIDSYPRMRDGLESGRLHMLVTFGVEVLQDKNLYTAKISRTGFVPGIILNKKHPLNRKKEVTYHDIQYETIGVLSDNLSVDNRSRVQNEFIKNGIYHPLNLKEYDSFSNFQIALAAGKCVAVMYERLMDGMEDKLVFYPVEETDLVGKEIVVAWKNEKYATKAKNFAELLESQLL